MNHPKREEWVPYLFDEVTSQTRRCLADHLQNCPDCAAEVAGWRQSLDKLDRWKLPRPRARSAQTLRPLLKWSAAAALALSVGIGVGRWSAPAMDLNALQTKIETSVKSSLAAELQREFNAAFRRDRGTTSYVTNEFQAQLDGALA